MSATDGHAQLVVLADLNNLAEIRGFVERTARQAGLDEEITSGLVLAVDEAAANVIVHGYRQDGRGRLEILATQDDASLTIRLRDEAPAYNPLDAPAPSLDSPLEERAIGGMGVLLIRQNTDRVEYNARDGRGNELVLVKDLA